MANRGSRETGCSNIEEISYEIPMLSMKYDIRQTKLEFAYNSTGLFTTRCVQPLPLISRFVAWLMGIDFTGDAKIFKIVD